MRLAFGLALIVLALGAVLTANFFLAAWLPSITQESFLVVWSILGPFAILGLYLVAGGWNLSFSFHLVFLGLIGLSVLGGTLPVLQIGEIPLQLLPLWGVPVLLTAVPVVIGLVLDKAND